MPETHTSFCRLCPAMCGICVEVEDGRPVKVYGDKDNPSTYGYTCKKGRALPELHNNPERLLNCVKKQPDGTHEAIPSETALDEVADRLRTIVDKYGPESVAVYSGTFQMMVPIGTFFAQDFLQKLGSRNWFCSGMIDQPGKPIALALHGMWEAGAHPFDHADRWMLLGANPFVSMWGGLSGFNPARSLKIAKERGLKLIVADPRRTETAQQADLYLQIKPGEDAALLAGMIRVILKKKLYDESFVSAEATGFDELCKAVEPFTPEYAGMRCGIPPEQVIEAAQLLASGTRGGPSVGTGPNMSGHGNLTEYLTLALHTLLGRWIREGEPVYQPNVLMPQRHPKAQAHPPYPAWGMEPALRTRGLGNTVAGMPTAALADEILTPGDGQVRALITYCSNPIAAWPDQLKAHEALQSLDLLVSLDIKLTQTTRLSNYIFAPPMSLEVKANTRHNELLYWYGVGNGYQKPFAQWADAVVPHPEGSDLLEEWEVFYGLAQRLGIQLELPAGAGNGLATPTPIDMHTKPAMEDLCRLNAAGARIPLDEVMKYKHGHVFEADLSVLPKDEGHAVRLQIGDPTMMDELAQIAIGQVPHDDAFPFKMISRRMRDFINSSGQDIAILTRNGGYNPAFMHPDDLVELNLQEGDEVEIESRRAKIFAIVGEDKELRRGTISMTHAFGNTPEFDSEFRNIGSPTGRLIDNARDYDPYTGIPLMSAIPVAIRALAPKVAETA